eukprot:Gb_00043 [translate_table: standard]
MMDTNYKSVVHKLMFYSLCICLIILIRLAAADPETGVAWQNCGQNSFTSSSVFQRNLNAFLNSLVDNIPSAGYKISSYEQSGNKIYGIIQCRADLILIDCRKCAAAAKTDLVNSCHNTSGLTQLDGCFLRYDNQNFTSNSLQMYHPPNVSCNKSKSNQPKLFTQKVRIIISNITSKAPTTPALFAAGSILGPSSTQIYALAQCWAYVSRTSCGSCLSLVNTVTTVSCQEGSIGAQISTLDCFLRFEVYSFFNTSILPQAATTSSSRTSNKRSIIPIIVGLLTAATVVLSIGTIVWKRKRVIRLVWNARDFHNRRSPDDMGFLVQKTWRLYETDQLSDVIDTTLLESSSRRAVEEGTRIAHIGLLCTQASPALRPTMSRVVHMLTTEQDQRLPVPNRPAFVDVENVINLTAQSSGSKTSSTGAEAFSSVLDAR